MASHGAFQPIKRLGKKARHGFRGYPVATVAFYGPDDRRASKVAVAILLREHEEPAQMRRWTSDDRDVRNDPAVAGAILDFLGEFDVKTVAMTDRIIGCPHEEGIDYQGAICPKCTFWVDRDRWTGEVIP